jgi:hypothetical protein
MASCSLAQASIPCPYPLEHSSVRSLADTVRHDCGELLIDAASQPAQFLADLGRYGESALCGHHEYGHAQGVERLKGQRERYPPGAQFQIRQPKPFSPALIGF